VIIAFSPGVMTTHMIIAHLWATSRVLISPANLNVIRTSDSYLYREHASARLTASGLFWVIPTMSTAALDRLTLFSQLGYG
jgi:hypothetical protein